MSAVVLVEREGPLAWVTVNRPEKLNALNSAVVAELLAVVGALTAAADPVRAAVLTGAGPKAFVAGADIAEMSGQRPADARAFAEAGHRLGRSIEETPFPWVAAVNGFALGGGCELALACDFIIASENARFGQPEVSLGLMPGFGGTQRLTRRVGVARARELVLTGDPIDATEALRIGLVNRVVPSAELAATARALASKIASRAPLAVAASRRAILRGADADLSVAGELEAAAFATLFGSDDFQEGTRAFLEKRAPEFRGR